MADTVEDMVAKIVSTIEEGTLLTKFIVIAEALDKNGGRAIFWTMNDNASYWDNLGMLKYVLKRQEIDMINNFEGD